MQVTHSADHITHALIGGNKTIEFGISNDAAFFQILSSTLYSDQRLAVAREVLCNAWDAHIRAGITDKPIEVTITDAKITVRDRAFGIAPDMMGPLYGTYGGTDKKNNGQETGGFGLGCKAPFAYGEHFEVTSWHLGTKTIYNLSKSSADKNGKPGITPIVALPTDETGLQVAIPLKTQNDRPLFKELFTRVARNGEMYVEINRDRVQTLPLSTSESNWLISSDGFGDNHTHRMFLRYGNVIYPIDTHQDYRAEYTYVLEFLQSLGKGAVFNYNIVFQAKPNTIAVTPSRESLSMQEHTIQTVKGLLSDFGKENLDEKIAKESEALLDRQIRRAVELRQVGDLMRNIKSLPGLREGSVDLRIIHNTALLAEQFTRRTYPKTQAFYKRDMGLRIDAAIELGIGHRGHLNQVKHHILKPKPSNHMRLSYEESRQEAKQPHEWFKRRILRPLYRDLLADPVMDIKRLFITGDRTTDHLSTPLGLRYQVHSDYLPLLRKVVVISFAKKEIWYNIKDNKEVLAHGDPKSIWFYHAQVSKTKIQAIRDFFTSRGFILVDFTSEENWSKYKTVSEYVPVAKRIAKPKPVGLPALSGVYSVNKATRVDNCFDDGAPRVNNPLFFHKILYSKADTREFSLGSFKHEGSHTLAKFFGDVCAIVRTDPQEKKLREAGLPELNEYVVDYVCDKVINSPSFQAYWPESINRALGSINGSMQDKLMTSLLDISEISKLLGLKSTLDKHDLMVRFLWEDIVENDYTWSRSKELPKITAAQNLIKAMPVSPILADIANKVKRRNLSELLNLRKVQEILHHPNAKLDGHLDWLAKLTHALLG